MKRNVNSKYLITRIFSIEYFRYYSSPAFFSAYFFPFIAVGKSRAYLNEELDEKIDNVRNNYHGNFYNFATQGFGNVAFDEKMITFDYFFERFSTYENDKNKYFKKVDGVAELETEKTKNGIYEALNIKGLMLKRNMAVAEEVKKELLNDLQSHEVKYVLAKMLYYIVDDKHMLPNIDMDYRDLISKKLGLSNEAPNVYMAFRKETDIAMKSFNKILMQAREIQLLCNDGVSLFGSNIAYRDCESKKEMYVKSLLNNRQINIEIILQSPQNGDIDESCINIKHLHISKACLSGHSISRIKKILRELYGNRLFLKITRQRLPYALMIFKFEDDLLDFIKLDLYSPFIEDNSYRPSMYILKKINPMLFEHFQNVFERTWSDENYSQFA